MKYASNNEMSKFIQKSILSLSPQIHISRISTLYAAYFLESTINAICTPTHYVYNNKTIVYGRVSGGFIFMIHPPLEFERQKSLN